MLATCREFLKCARYGLLAISLIAVTGANDDVGTRTIRLPSWNNTASKTAIVSFVENVTRQGSHDFVPEPERIAVFDNDGTLWSRASHAYPARLRSGSGQDARTATS